jgi:hypothetical protein
VRSPRSAWAIALLITVSACAPAHHLAGKRSPHCQYGYNQAKHRCYFHSDEYWTFDSHDNLITVPARNW